MSNKQISNRSVTAFNFPTDKQFSLGTIYTFTIDDDNRTQVTKRDGVYHIQGFLNGKHFSYTRPTHAATKAHMKLLERNPYATNPSPRIGSDTATSGYESTLAYQVMNHDALMLALHSLNAVYGKGDIRKNDQARQKVFIVPYGGSGKWYQYKIFTNKDGSKSIQLHGHKQRIAGAIRYPNPAPRIGTARPRRVSQITKKPPTKRLVARRKRNTDEGYFPNPIDDIKQNVDYEVYVYKCIKEAQNTKGSAIQRQARLSYAQGLIIAGFRLKAFSRAEMELFIMQLKPAGVIGR